jgi:hypothetical protein
MKLGKELSTGYAHDAFDDDTDEELTVPAAPERTPEPVEVTAEATRPRQVVDAAAR